MGRIPALVLLLAGLSPAWADEPKGDLAKLQGTWETRLGPKKDLPLVWVVEGDKLVAHVTRADGSKVTTRCTLKLDEKARPRALDQTKIRVDFGGDVGELASDEDSPAIYELNGDEWKLCLVPFGSPRPKAFVAGPESDVLVMKRVSKPKAKAK